MSFTVSWKIALLLVAVIVILTYLVVVRLPWIAKVPEGLPTAADLFRNPVVRRQRLSPGYHARFVDDGDEAPRIERRYAPEERRYAPEERRVAPEERRIPPEERRVAFEERRFVPEERRSEAKSVEPKKVAPDDDPFFSSLD